MQTEPGAIDELLSASAAAGKIYARRSLAERRSLLHLIADELETDRDAMISMAMEETHLPEARLRQEHGRTVFQLRSYGDHAASGQWMDLRIDTAKTDRLPAKPDLRKMMVPLGPVLVFGASNFPFAYSTAGGDTASALAAGCPVIVKAHPAHPQTGDIVSAAIHRAIAKAGLPIALFTHIHGEQEIGETLVKHPMVKAVGFTGSLSGGRQLYDWGASRKEPIPVFAEMGSVNPVYLFPAKMETDAVDMAMKYAQSITASAGQVCTNPGLIIGISGTGLELFLQTLQEQILHIKPEPMLHTGIYKAYVEKRAAAISQEGVDMGAVSAIDAAYEEASPTIAVTDAAHFLANPLLHQEVFGPYSLVIRCQDMPEMEQVAEAMEGQLTSAIIATPEEVLTFDSLVDKIRSACGRLIFNGVPTGVEVCLSMQHGGPYPACTDSRFTAVGGDALKRFARPVTYQNWPEELLPDELKTSNPLNLVRTVNNEPGRH